MVNCDVGGEMEYDYEDGDYRNGDWGNSDYQRDLPIIHVNFAENEND